MIRLKPISIILGSLLVLIFMVKGAYCSEVTRAFLDGISLYNEGNYAKAVRSFTKIADSGVTNGNLFYNLGNAHLKNNQLGRAILWYERALKLLPTDPDLKFNYTYALSLVKDAPEEKTGIFRVLFFWKHLLNQRAVQWIGIMLNLLLWLFLILRTVWKRPASRLAVYLLLAMTIVFAATAMYNHYETVYIRHAIILPSQISVRSGVVEDATELFVLHAGTKVKIERETDKFFRIYFSKGKIGWIKKSEVGVI